DGVLSAEAWQQANPDALSQRAAIFQRFLDSHSAKSLRGGLEKLLSPDVQARLGSSPARQSADGRLVAPANTPAIRTTDGRVLAGPALFASYAYHGTPHKVDRFSTDKIGTGEGAQAYGWGL